MSLSELRSTWERLTRDPAFRVGTIYAGASWFIIEAVDTLGGSTGAIRLLAGLLAAGFALLVPAVWLLTRAGSASGSTDKALRSPLSDGDGAEAALSADRRQPPSESGTTPELAGRRAGRRPGPWGTRVWATALAVTLMLAAGAWWLGTRPGRAVPAAATHIAVLPFHATGSDAARELGTGLVDLLSAAMDDVAGIRTVSSRSVLARTASARASTPGVPMTLEAALELGSDLGAGSVLMGSVTAANGRVRLNGEVRAVADGAVLAAAEAEGQEAEVLAVADALAVDLLRAMWRSGDPIPAVETASLTTRSPAALRWYLAGERHLRAMRMDSATAAFRQAVAADSTFALAWLRLTESTGWTDGDGTAESVGERRSYVVRARAFADRLPPRARSLVNAVDLVLDGDMASFDSLNAFVTRYPDDPHGWYLLGDARFHAALLGLHSSQEITEPFLQATRLDPAFALGLAHPLELALDRGDRAEYDRLLARYQAVATSDDVEEHELQARVRWAPRDSVLHHFLAEVRPLDARDTRRLNLLIGVLGNRVRLDPEVDPMIYVAAMDSVLALAPGNRAWQDRASFLAAANLLALGRGEEGLRRLDDWLALSPNLSGELPVNLERSLMRMVQAMEHDLPLTMVVGDIAMAEGAADEYPFIQPFLHFFHLNTGSPDLADRYEADLGQLQLIEGADSLGVRLASEGWDLLLRGDTARAIPALERGIRLLGFRNLGAVTPALLPYATALSELPATREQGLRMLRFTTTYSAVETAEAFLALARALEQAERREEARQAYAHVVRLWDGADDYRQDEVREARDALVRLTGEGSARPVQ